MLCCSNPLKCWEHEDTDQIPSSARTSCRSAMSLGVHVRHSLTDVPGMPRPRRAVSSPETSSAPSSSSGKAASCQQSMHRVSYSLLMLTSAQHLGHGLYSSRHCGDLQLIASRLRIGETVRESRGPFSAATQATRHGQGVRDGNVFFVDFAP